MRGATTDADLSRVRVTRDERQGVRTYFVDMSGQGIDFALQDGDIVMVPSRLTEHPAGRRTERADHQRCQRSRPLPGTVLAGLDAYRHFPIAATGVGFLATIVFTLTLFGP